MKLRNNKAILKKTLFVLLIIIGANFTASAQTKMISAGFDNRGNAIYREVFEYDFVDEKPQFPGGDDKFMEFVNRNREYPREAYDRGIQGRVTCSFVVNEDGHISNVQLLKRVHSLIDYEAIRLFEMMPNWIPGKIQGVAVPVRVIKYVRFQK